MLYDYKIMSKEIAIYDPLIEHKESLDLLDLTLVCNRHRDAGDAEKSAAVIPLGSLVFIEGYGGVHGGITHIEYLGQLRLLKGVDSEEYRAAKSEIRDIYRGVSMRPARDTSDFIQHGARLALELIEKDCVVVVADYSDMSAAVNGDNQDFVQKQNEIFNRSRDIITSGLTYQSAPTASAYINQQTRIERDIYLGNQYRENMVQAKILRHVAMTFRLPEFNAGFLSMVSNENGKIPAYLIFGTAHKRSLFRNLTELGISRLKVVDLHPVDEEKYMIASPEEFHNTINSRIAQKAFSSVMLEMLYLGADKGRIAELKQRANEVFGVFNGKTSTSTDQYIAFLNDAVWILHQLDRGIHHNDEEFQAIMKRTDSLIRCFVDPSHLLL
jgi:hypothetical protein